MSRICGARYVLGCVHGTPSSIFGTYLIAGARTPSHPSTCQWLDHPIITDHVKTNMRRTNFDELLRPYLRSILPPAVTAIANRELPLSTSHSRTPIGLPTIPQHYRHAVSPISSGLVRSMFLSRLPANNYQVFLLQSTSREQGQRRCKVFRRQRPLSSVDRT